MTSPVRIYLAELHKIHAMGAGTDEVSLYNPLQNLLNEIGAKLRPKVFCIQNLKDLGAGFPDYGLYGANQLPKTDFGKLTPDIIAERGVIEAKAPSERVEIVADTGQVRDYWERYGLVLVTTFRAFLIAGRDQFGRRQNLEHFSLAGDEAEFWALAARPAALAPELETRFTEFLTRVLLHNAPLTQPSDVAWFLASYARDSLARLEGAGADLANLDMVRESLEEGLGIAFEGPKGEHFFRSALVQTLYYGLFSAWVLWCRHTPDPEERKGFSAAGAAWHLRLPVLRGLFEQVNRPGALGPLRLDEVLEWAAGALRRVDDAAFFARFQEDHAVQYFYEPFLEAFDPELRKQLGVWYTPPEVVDYMVERVDRTLRDQLDIADGLADDRVVVLDPCCGTGSYLAAVLRRIERTLRDNGEDALVGQFVKKAAMSRVVGFEIMPAPFVVAHMQIGLLLEGLGAPLAEQGSHTSQRAEWPRVLLTNALTGWDPSSDKPKHLPLPDFHDEMDKAREVKREAPILVVLGNPPYNAFAGTSSKEEGGLVELYKDGLISKWGIKKFNLDDLYIRFFRIAERRIAEQTGKGIVCFISNFSYLGDPSFVVMRQRLLQEFDKIWIDCLNGDSRETGKLTPDGKPDPSIFSTKQNKAGIRKGTAISLFSKTSETPSPARVEYRNFWGSNKREDLIKSLEAERFGLDYQEIHPEYFNKFSYRPFQASEDYKSWPRITDLSLNAPYNGPVERRGFALISIDKRSLKWRMEKYFDPSVPNDDIRYLYPSLMMTGSRIDGPKARQKIIRESTFDPSKIVKYPFKPFDIRWCYLDNIRPLFSEPSPDLIALSHINNAFLITRDTADKAVEGTPFYFSGLICDYDFLSGHARHFPVSVFPKTRREKPGQDDLPGLEGSEHDGVSNLSDGTRTYLNNIDVEAASPIFDGADLTWLHCLAIGYAPTYLTENAHALRQDWPRVPLPAAGAGLEASAALGRRVAALLDAEQGVAGVTEGRLRAELRVVGVVRRRGGGGLSDEDLRVTAGWGHAGQNRVTMPGKGAARERDYAPEERAAIAEGAAALGLSLEAALAGLGATTFDVHLNEEAYWANVPARVWAMSIGGYQVMKKWLSYREYALLGRPLKPEEARSLTGTARRLTALRLLEPALNANYNAVRAETYPWPRTERERA